MAVSVLPLNQGLKNQQPQVSIKGALTALCLRVCSCSTLCSYRLKNQQPQVSIKGALTALCLRVCSCSTLCSYRLKNQQPQVSIKGALTALCLLVCSCSTLCSYSTHRHVNTKNLPLTKRSTQCSQRVCHAAQTMDMAALAWR